MERKFTKGKWVLHKTNALNCKSIKDENNNYIAMLSLNVVRPCLMKEQMPINESNALLISKAPEMFEMLERMLSNYDKGTQTYLDCKQLLKEATEL